MSTKKCRIYEKFQPSLSVKQIKKKTNIQFMIIENGQNLNLRLEPAIFVGS